LRIKFKSPQVNLFVESLEIARGFYEKLGFKVTFTAEIAGRTVHHELVLDGFNLGIATKESAWEVYGLNTGEELGCEIVLWTDDADEAMQYLLENDHNKRRNIIL
jgi:hypothetical protein